MKPKNRWLIALSAVSIHLSIGSAYAYSVFKNPLAAKLGWDNQEIAFSFTLAIFFLGISAALFGRFVERRGPRVSAAVAAVLFAGGLAGAGLAIHYEALFAYYLSYGVVGGIGLGIGYIAPVSTLVKWFPDRRGLATGMAVLGFGAGALICSPVVARLVESIGLSATFYTLSAVYFILMISGAAYIARPAEGWMPEGMVKQGSSPKQGGRRIKQDLAQMLASEAVKTKRFWLLWVMMFINISAGIMIISVASPMAQEKVGMSVAAAATMVGVMGFFNGGGRIGWASLSDYLGRTNTFTMFFAIQLVLFLLLPQVSSPLFFQLFIFIILTCYGGGFASLPAYIGDLFGTKQLGAIHGYLLTSWSAAGVAGPMLVAYIRDATSSYNTTFYIFGALLALALVTTILLRLDIKAVENEKAPPVSVSLKI
ncbi:MFS transporter [Paenibacillaceae bacterium]|nr:MFS transporter [Paenibacillaceae bacterium]